MSVRGRKILNDPNSIVFAIFHYTYLFQFRFIKINLKLILQIARRKMEKILKDQVKNKLTNDQISNLSNIMAEGTAPNTNVDRENANEQIFLNNLIKEM